MTDIYLVRHGETDFNQAGRLQGHSASRLTLRGKEQARFAASYFEKMTCARLISSDLHRCVETADLMGDTLNLQPKFDTRLRELGLGKAEGWQRDQALTQFPGLTNLWEHPDRSPSPGSETPRQLQKRLSDFLHSLSEEIDTTIVVAHAGPILGMVALAGGHSLKEAQNLSLANGSICKCNLNNSGLEIIAFNMTDHLHDEHRQNDVYAYQR